MQPKVAFETPEEACKAVQREMGKITARPYNLHDPEGSEWWLIPGSADPAVSELDRIGDEQLRGWGHPRP